MDVSTLNLISQTYIVGTSTGTTTGEQTFSYIVYSPFLIFLTIAIIFGLTIPLFIITFKTIWD